MRYTDAEMIFFNSLLDGRAIFGLDIKKPFVIDNAYIEGTIQGLKEKYLINEDGSLANVHPNPIILLEFYKKAEIYIAHDQTRIGLLEDANMVGIRFNPEGYEIFSCETWKYLYELFVNTPILNEKMKQYVSTEEVETTPDDYVALILSHEYEGASIFKKYKSAELSEEYTFLWNDTVISLIDGLAHKKRNIDGHQARLLLFTLFELDIKAGMYNG